MQQKFRVRGVDPDGDRLTFGVTGPDAQLVRLEQQGDNQVRDHGYQDDDDGDDDDQDDDDLDDNGRTPSLSDLNSKETTRCEIMVKYQVDNIRKSED